MEFDLSPEQQEFRRTVRAFAEEVVRPAAEEADRREELPTEVVRAMGELGLFGVPFPEELGGQGADLLTFCLAVEELGRVDQSVAVTLAAAVGLGGMPILRYGTEEQRRTWLEPLCRGEALLAFALTEPDAGSDAAAIRTRARPRDGGWVLEGEKAIITIPPESGSKVQLLTVRGLMKPKEDTEEGGGSGSEPPAEGPQPTAPPPAGGGPGFEGAPPGQPDEGGGDEPPPSD